MIFTRPGKYRYDIPTHTVIPSTLRALDRMKKKKMMNYQKTPLGLGVTETDTYKLTVCGEAYWAGRAAAAHFSVLVGKAYSLPAHFLWLKIYILS